MPSLFSADQAAFQANRRLGVNGAQVLHRHLAGQGGYPARPKGLAHGLVEHGGNDAAMQVTGWTLKAGRNGCQANDAQIFGDHVFQMKAGDIGRSAAKTAVQHALLHRSQFFYYGIHDFSIPETAISGGGTSPILRRLSRIQCIQVFGGTFCMDRRTAIKHLGGAASALLLTDVLSGQASPASQSAAAIPPSPATGPFTLPPLPYAYDALEPYFDAETMHLHHDKHHQAYVNNLNAAVAAHPELAGKTVYELVANLASLPKSTRTAVRNNGGGHVNHSFWWPTLGKSGSAPSGELAKAINAKFGSLSGFQDKLTAAAMSVFGSGWAWLVKLPDGTLAIETTSNQDSPLTIGHKPVLTVDVWEHAYYLKYQNRRAEYAKAFLQVVNWDYVSGQFAQKA